MVTAFVYPLVSLAFASFPRLSTIAFSQKLVFPRLSWLHVFPCLLLAAFFSRRVISNALIFVHLIFHFSPGLPCRLSSITNFLFRACNNLCFYRV